MKFTQKIKFYSALWRELHEEFTRHEVTFFNEHPEVIKEGLFSETGGGEKDGDYSPVDGVFNFGCGEFDKEVTISLTVPRVGSNEERTFSRQMSEKQIRKLLNIPL